MRDALRTSFVMLAILTVLTGLLYPLVVTAVAQVVFPSRSNGSLIIRGGEPVGSSLVGQAFTEPRYFWGRPSATSPTPYNAASSGGSNLGPLNPALLKNVQSRLGDLRRSDPKLGTVPADLVTASGSGLDPHVSPASAEAQVPRVAKARRRSEDEVRRIVARLTEGRQLGVLGEPRVNVLLLNLALDGYWPTDATAAWSLMPLTRHTLPVAAPNKLRTHLRLRDIFAHGRKPHGEAGTWGGTLGARPSRAPSYGGGQPGANGRLAHD